MLVTGIPVIGWIMIPVWAFTGSNETRKNYFRAILAWILIATVIAIGVILIGGGWPEIQKHIHDRTHKL